MRPAKRRGVAVIIATLIMVAAAVLFTSIMMFWGLSFQGQSLSNYGSAINRSNNAAAEEISIDNVLFTKVTSSPNTYTATVYVRNFGDSPLKLAGIHLKVLQGGISPAAYDCEVTIGGGIHLTIVSRAMQSITLNTASPSSGNPGCTSPITFSSTWDAQTISIELDTDAGTKFHNNYAVPA